MAKRIQGSHTVQEDSVFEKARNNGSGRNPNNMAKMLHPQCPFGFLSQVLILSFPPN